VDERIKSARGRCPSGSLKPPYKLIFMDCNMPQMDGFDTTVEIIRKCQENGVELPYIIALTAHSDSDKNIKEKCEGCGMNEIKMKPMKSDDIKALFTTLKIDFTFVKM